MAKKKSSRKVQKKVKQTLDKHFTCLFCNHAQSVDVKMSSTIGTLSCRVCGVRWQMSVTALDEPVDVYSAWVDAAEEASKNATDQAKHSLLVQQVSQQPQQSAQPRARVQQQQQKRPAPPVVKEKQPDEMDNFVVDSSDEEALETYSSSSEEGEEQEEEGSDKEDQEEEQIIKKRTAVISDDED